MKEHR
jgi:hypothetical protein